MKEGDLAEFTELRDTDAQPAFAKIGRVVSVIGDVAIVQFVDSDRWAVRTHQLRPADPVAFAKAVEILLEKVTARLTARFRP